MPEIFKITFDEDLHYVVTVNWESDLYYVYNV